MIGLCGAHRVGKSTLAEAYGEATGMPVVLSNISKIVADMGIDMADDLPLGVRLTVQNVILNEAEDQYETQAGNFISDRTPIDMAAYVLAECLKASGSPADQERALEYVERCFAVASRYFSIFMLIEPGIPFVAAPGKPPPNRAFQEHIHLLVRALLDDARLTRPFYVIPRALTDHADRLTGLTDVWGQHMVEFNKSRANFLFH